MLKNVTYSFLLLSAVFLANGTVLAGDSPTLDQVYQATQAGKMNEAQSMMGRVLIEHPNSAKAHFVEAELFAAQGKMGSAEEELRTAERLEPGLSFANPQAVQDLKNRIATQHIVGSAEHKSIVYVDKSFEGMLQFNVSVPPAQIKLVPIGAWRAGDQMAIQVVASNKVYNDITACLGSEDEARNYRSGAACKGRLRSKTPILMSDTITDSGNRYLILDNSYAITSVRLRIE